MNLFLLLCLLFWLVFVLPLRLLETLFELVGSLLVHRVDPPLVEVYEEDEVITETRETVHGWHLDDESEQVIYESVERFVDENSPREVSHTLELVVDEELRSHENESKSVNGSSEGSEYPRVPTFVRFVDEGVDGVGDD